jgi:16S rRNA (guanine966-N2)-methyltransferase
MRIIAGELKGRRLKTPTWQGLRPTSDKLRETLFNVIAARVAGATVLDGFAGTGAIGLESLSRGAARVVFVESDRRAIQLIRANVELCGVGDRCAIIRGTVEHALHNEIAGDRFDLVMLDPPYDFAPLAAMLGAVARHVASDGLVILEHAARRSVPAVDLLRAIRTVRSGDSTLTMFEAHRDPGIHTS